MVAIIIPCVKGLVGFTTLQATQVSVLKLFLVSSLCSLYIEYPTIEGVMSFLKGISSHGGDLEVFKGSVHRWPSFCQNTNGDLQVTIAGRPSLTAVRTLHWSSQHLSQDRLPLMEMFGLLSDTDYPSYGSPKSILLPLVSGNICPPRPSLIFSTNHKQRQEL